MAFSILLPHAPVKNSEINASIVVSFFKAEEVGVVKESRIKLGYK